jgi:hypothetical protein
MSQQPSGRIGVWLGPVNTVRVMARTKGVVRPRAWVTIGIAAKVPVGLRAVCPEADIVSSRDTRKRAVG